MEVKLKVDKVGRVTIPKTIRTSLNIETNKQIRVFVNQDAIVIFNQDKEKKDERD